MNYTIPISAIASLLLMFVSCSGQQKAKEQVEATIEQQARVVPKQAPTHQYGGWYCPDNFGFVPVDIQNWDEVPAIADRLPTEAELQHNMSLIKIDTVKYPGAKALEMDLPRVASIHSTSKGMRELIIVIQAIVVQEDTVVGYRFVNGGNGSGRLREVSFLSDAEIAEMGAQPFFYETSVLNASPSDIWTAMGKTAYFKQLGEKFDKQAFFSAEWNPDSQARLLLDSDAEKATGHAGVVYGNFYLQIDYDRNGFHYSEKLLMVENQEDNTTELFFASGPFPKDFGKQESYWAKWFDSVEKASDKD